MKSMSALSNEGNNCRAGDKLEEGGACCQHSNHSPISSNYRRHPGDISFGSAAEGYPTIECSDFHQGGFIQTYPIHGTSAPSGRYTNSANVSPSYSIRLSSLSKSRLWFCHFFIDLLEA